MKILKNGQSTKVTCVTDYISAADTHLRRGKASALYKDITASFDIETSRIEEIDHSIMYIWQIDIDNIYQIYGRTWEELTEFFEMVCDCLETAEFLVFWVHNLAYEFQFLSGIYNFRREDVFAIKSRRPLYARLWKHIEFRCSYYHSNMSLEKFCKYVGADYQKAVGDLDYTVVRTPSTPLTDQELHYCLYDVMSLTSAIQKELIRDGDTIATIPLTSTGYVRREFREALKSERKRIMSYFPDAELYTLLRQAFRGGNTHANRWIVGEILENVHSRDKVSSYPTQQLDERYPMGKFKKRFYNSIEKLQDCCETHNYCWLAEIKMLHVKLKDPIWGCPYIPLDKCRDIVKHDSYVVDNGRIIECDELTITITNVDWDIISTEYGCETEILVCYTAKCDYLPEDFRNLVRKLFADKTALKGVDDYLYGKQKNKFNALFGMTAQDPGKESYYYDKETDNIWNIDEKEVDSILGESRHTMFLVYQWGVWCTAHARYALEEGIRNVHDSGDMFVYCDTDSVKYVGEKTRWETLNNTIEKKSRENGGVAKDRKGIEHILGVFEHDGEYQKFCTMGAKKYCYIENDTFHITVAGVPKKEGAAEMIHTAVNKVLTGYMPLDKKKLKEKILLETIKQFSPGYVFHAGKLESLYNDLRSPITYNYKGEKLTITNNIVLRPTTYELGYGDDYAKLLQSLDIRIKHLVKINKNY